jgi:DNA-binding NarL/FixJ family response regulator
LLWRWLARALTQAGLCQQISTLRITGPALALGVLVFSQYIETQSAGSPEGVGYLLKDRVADVSEFVDAITRAAGGGGTVLGPEVARHLLRASRCADALAVLTPREREVLAFMAQDRSNTAIASEFTISPRVVERHVASIFAKLGLEPSGHDNRGVLATIKYLESRPARGQSALGGPGVLAALTRLLPWPLRMGRLGADVAAIIPASPCPHHAPGEPC